MISTIIITTLVLWTVFGFFVLFSLGEDLKKITMKHLFLIGPALTTGLIIVGLFSVGLEKAMDWAKK